MNGENYCIQIPEVLAIIDFMMNKLSSACFSLGLRKKLGSRWEILNRFSNSVMAMANRVLMSNT
jgi:hypothetical protein